MKDLLCEQQPFLTRVDFSIVGNTIGINNGLVAASELVGLEIGGRGIGGAHSVEDGGDCGATPLLRSKVREYSNIRCALIRIGVDTREYQTSCSLDKMFGT